MRTNRLTLEFVRRVAVAAALLAAAAIPAGAHEVHLVAAPVTKSVTLPDQRTIDVPMWGFALDANANGLVDGTEAVTVPGPRITVPPGDTSLVVHLANRLTGPGAEAVSFVVLGLDRPRVGASATPAPPTRVGTRVVAMTAETAPGDTQVYTFVDVRAGTFLYQSGSHQAVQVQMGLYGALTQDAATGQAYAGVPYANEAVLLYSEVDVALHAAVAAGTFGRSDLGGPTSTIDYEPSLFLVNGESYANELSATIAAGAAGQTTLLRLLNSGLRTHAPVLENGTLRFVAEDGNPYPYLRTQAAVLLSAGKTQDAVWDPASAGVYPVYDRALSLNAAGQGPAGMLARLRVSGPASTDTVIADHDSYATAEDTPVAAPVLGNDTPGASAELLTVPHSGTVVAAAGGFSYHPAPDFFGVDSFTYRAVLGTDVSQPATVTITVSAAPDPPTAFVQALGTQSPDELPITLGGHDPDGDALSFYVTDLPDHGIVSIIDPIINEARTLEATDLRTGPGTGTPIPSGVLLYAPSTAPSAYTGPDALQFVAADAASDSTAAGVAITVHPGETTTALAGDPLALTVRGSDNSQVNEYYWVLEEDRTFDVVPGVATVDTPSVNFHRSYMPVVQSGDESTQPLVEAGTRYFVSVLPKSTSYTNGGAAIAGGQNAVEVVVNKTPIPTAQVRVRVFHDNSPTDGMFTADEAGLPGFEVTLEDAGGRYGMSASQQLMDAYGNPLGTVYRACSGPPNSCTSYEVQSYGNGFVLTDAAGYALFQNLPPGKFGVKVRRPGGTEWVQTSTIEGSPTIDAWVKPNEPQFFMEFGPPAPHAEIGMVRPTRNAAVLGAGPGPFSTVSGDITNMRLSRPPDPRLYSGGPFDFTRPWVALNAGAVNGNLLYAGPTDADGHFEISGVPSGSYQLVVFDSALDVIIGSKVINVSAPTDVALGAQPVFSWFHRVYHFVFEDQDEDGYRDDNEPGIPEQAVNIRWRDGTMYQSSATDRSGFVPFEETFPFFSWQVAEVDYTRLKATGVTVVVDGGGDSSAAGNAAWPGQVGAPDVDSRVLVPQPQSENANGPSRTETGPILVEAFQGFIGQTNMMMWGKKPYAAPGTITPDVNVAPFDTFPGDAGDVDANGNGVFDVDQYHGGITGIVHYSVTRAEGDPRFGGPEVWEPGIPGVRVQLWDAKRSKLLNEVTTDSWDDNVPTGCQGPAFTYLGVPRDCFDGLRNFNQVRPGLFDGGYAFYSVLEPYVDAEGRIMPIASRTIQKPIPPGEYVVKVIPPRGYKIVKEEDKNVDFGQDYIPQQFLLTGYPLGDPGPPDPAADPIRANYSPVWAPFCVGTVHDVPPNLALFPGVPGVYGGTRRPLCDAKLVRVRNGQNAAANFFLFTEAPIAGHITGFVLDDTQNEFDPNSPQFGEKYAPPFLPVAIRDWNGREITRTYTDRHGVYNALVPSTFTANSPIPSGMNPAMLTACINAPTMPGPGGTIVADPHFNKSYSHFCYTFQYMPGATTYLDTPVLPTAAFTGADQFPVDAELPNLTPVIKQVNGTALNLGPYIVDRGAGGANTPNGRARTILIDSVGAVQVPNPAYAGVEGSTPKLIERDYGFGPASLNGVVRLGGQPVTVTSWSNTQIRAVVPTGTSFRTGELTVERCLARAAGACTDSRASILGITLTVVNANFHNNRPPRAVAPGQSIQAVIDSPSTLPGDLVLVPPGVYEEMVVMTKPVRLQGWGAPVTVINTVAAPSEKFQAWRDLVAARLAANPGFLLASQTDILGAAPFDPAEMAAALGGEAAGVTVFARNGATAPLLQRVLWLANTCSQRLTPPYTLNNDLFCRQNENPGTLQSVLRPNARIDGLSLVGASQAPGVMVNAYARTLEIGNNKIYNNTGNFAGGISVGHPGAQLPLADEDAVNNSVLIHHNLVTQNAGLDAEGGGGIVLGTGSQSYEVSNNFVAGNFTAGQGAGIAHIGLSPGGVIDRNTVAFNESFDQMTTRSGGGVFVGGRPPAGALPAGSGSVRVSNNLIQGNQAAAGDGGGVALAYVNGTDITQFQGIFALLRYRVDLFNNVIVNNEAALAGGGIALQDAPYTRIVHNTVVHNDSLATAGAAFTLPGNARQSAPQPAGIVSRGHTPALVQALGSGAAAFTDPLLVNSIVWENRSFYFGEKPGGVVVPGDPNPPVQYGLIAASTPYWDLGVLGAPAGSQLNPASSVLTSTTGYVPSNSSAAPAFVAQYVNGSRNPTIRPNNSTLGLEAPVAFDEGGNAIRPTFGPLTLTDPASPAGAFFGNYHLTAGVAGAALNGVFGSLAAIPSELGIDFDLQARPRMPSEGVPHRGADQVQTAGTPITPTTPMPAR
jgi:FtsP/CotA-like multicopper oxidase with cupredoxin domain